MRTRKSPAVFLIGILLIIPVVVSIFPFLYMGYTSLRQVTRLNFEFTLRGLTFTNYVRVLTGINFASSLVNSMIVTSLACVLNCIVSSMAAYGFAKKEFPMRGFLFTLYLATMMVPGCVTMIPLFVMMNKLHMLNTYIALALPIINAFGVFLIRQFMVSLPNDILEAATIDGCGETRCFVQVVIPLVSKVMITLATLTFIEVWNDFVWPLIVITDSKKATLTLSLSVLKGNYSTNYGLVMAGTTLTFLPPFVLYIFCQKQFVEGVAMSGIKA